MPEVRTDQEWIRDLQSAGPQQAEAIGDLRQLLLRGTLYTLARNLDDLQSMDYEARLALAEDCTQEALIAVLARLNDFRGEARFTSWTFKFAINIALSRARRERWKRVSLEDWDEDMDSLDWLNAQIGSFPGPDIPAMQSEVYAAIREAIRTALTPRQRQVLKWIVFDEAPMDVVVQRLGTNRNAVYKLLHDARRKLKRDLDARGFPVQDILALFR